MHPKPLPDPRRARYSQVSRHAIPNLTPARVVKSLRCRSGIHHSDNALHDSTPRRGSFSLSTTKSAPESTRRPSTTATRAHGTGVPNPTIAYRRLPIGRAAFPLPPTALHDHPLTGSRRPTTLPRRARGYLPRRNGQKPRRTRHRPPAAAPYDSPPPTRTAPPAGSVTSLRPRRQTVRQRLSRTHSGPGARSPAGQVDRAGEARAVACPPVRVPDARRRGRVADRPRVPDAWGDACAATGGGARRTVLAVLPARSWADGARWRGSRSAFRGWRGRGWE